jgi:tight adherence protein C
VSAPALAVLATLLGAAALWELVGSRGEELGRLLRETAAKLSGGRLGTLASAALWFRLPERLQRAGLAGRIPVAVVLAGKLAGAAAGGILAALAAPALPGNLAIVVALAIPAAGFVAPEALLDRAARRRRMRIAAALPDALDLLAVGTAAGRSPITVLGEISASGPLGAELALAAAEIQCGVPQREALATLRDRTPGAGLGAMTSALERSRRFGSPLAEQLHEQAAALRAEERRQAEERAARAAPKIQLVVALVLVPSVLLMILAALIAHSDVLFGTF